MSGAIAFLAGLGTGYLNESKNQKKQKGEDEDRALRNEASQLQITAAKKQLSDQATLADAGKPIAMTEGAGGMLKPASMDNRDVGLPENAALPNQGLQVGGYNVAGKQFADPVAAQAAVTTANTPEAIQKRVLAAQMGIDPSKGIAMQRDIAQATVADGQAADAVFRRKLGVAMATGHEGLAKLVTESQSDGLAEHQIKPVVSADGKTVTYNKIDKDGKLTPTPLTFPNSEEGVIAAAYRLDQSITPAMRADFAAKQGDKAQAQSNADRTHTLAVSTKDEVARHNKAQEGLMSQRIAMAGAGSGGKGGAAEEAAPYNPLGDFQMKEAQVESIKQAAQAARESALADKPMSPADQGRLQQKIYRGMADAHAAEATNRQRASVFLANARQAKTPEEVEAVRQRAAQSGYTPQEMAQLDARFAPVAKPLPPGTAKPGTVAVAVKPITNMAMNGAAAPVAATAPQAPQPKPERAAGEGLQVYKQRLVAWDTNRMAYEEAMSDAAIRNQNETLRQQAVAARPGLAQMGTGLR